MIPSFPLPQRLRQEADYHKRLRQGLPDGLSHIPRTTLKIHLVVHAGADQRSYELEDRLKHQERQTSSFDEAQTSLIEQSQLLVSKNAELQRAIKGVGADQLGLLLVAQEMASLTHSWNYKWLKRFR